MAKKMTKRKAVTKGKSTRKTTKKAGATKKAAATKQQKTKKAPRSRAGKVRTAHVAKKGSTAKPSAPVDSSPMIESMATLAPAAVAEAAGCLDQEVATAVVFACTGVGPVDPGVKLGQLFPGPTQRQGFCGCVVKGASAAGAAIAGVPCTASTTIGQVIDSLSC